MSDRAARSAADAHFASLKQAISRITRIVLLRIPLSDTSGWLTTLATLQATLRGTSSRAFTFNHEYIVRRDAPTGETRIIVLAYNHVLLDSDATELIAYHWHPTGESLVTTPHLHVIANRRTPDLSKAHLPTGVVTPFSILRCLITEFGVAPLRPDWETILRDA